MMRYPYTKRQCEYLRYQARQRFDKVRSTWVDSCKWALPHRNNWLLSQVEGERKNQHIVDSTHVLALRSYVAGFLEGNTSANRPWFRLGTGDAEKNLVPENHQWLDKLTRRTLKTLSASNFYHAAGEFYYDYGVVNSGAHYVEELPGGELYFHTLIPGSYFVINNSYSEAVVLVRELSLSVKALVDRYGPRKENGSRDWSNISDRVKKLYEDSNYTQTIEIVQVIKENDDFDPEEPQALLNKKWIAMTYETGESRGDLFQDGQDNTELANEDEGKYLEVAGSKRKPFIVGRSTTSNNFEWGEKGPTTDALGLIKSLNKKAIGKDQALEQMLRPALQGPANLRKSYITTASNSFIPLDAKSIAQKGLRPVFEINPAIGALIQDVGDMRQQVDKLYYADFLLFLSSNPKTRTATETQAVVDEQKLVIGPNLQSLNWTYNVPIIDFVMEFVLDVDPLLPPPPRDLEGQFLRPEFISVFAQAQKAADLPAVNRYVAMISDVAQINPAALDKLNVDKLADIYEDRLYLPAGLNNPSEKVEAMRQQALAQQERQQGIEELTKKSIAAKNVGLQVNQSGGN